MASTSPSGSPEPSPGLPDLPADAPALKGTRYEWTIDGVCWTADLIHAHPEGWTLGASGANYLPFAVYPSVAAVVETSMIMTPTILAIDQAAEERGRMIAALRLVAHTRGEIKN